MDASQRTYRFLPADVYIAGYRVVGKIMVGTNGIMGVLNDTTKSHLEIQDARMARIHMPTKLVDHFETVRLVKSQVFAACTTRREDLGPSAVVRGGYSNMTPKSGPGPSRRRVVRGTLGSMAGSASSSSASPRGSTPAN